MRNLKWLTARPIAHRGLHDAAAGVIENTATAFSAAIAGGYGIECDLQVSADGEAMVYHDDALGRLTEGSGRLAEMSAAAIARCASRQSADRILTLGELCDLVAGRVTLLLELKSRFDGDLRLAARAAAVLAALCRAGGGNVVRSGTGRGAAPRRARAWRAAWWRNGTTIMPNGRRCRARASAQLALAHPCAAHAAAFHRLCGQGPAGGRAVDRPASVRPAAPDLDRAQRGRSPARGRLRRPDHL